MKVPVSWLKSYIDIEMSLQELSDLITFAGIEVEGIEEVGHALPNMVVGEVRSFEQHPNADRLRKCVIFDGEQEIQIICGASNFKQGDKVALGLVGATLPAGFTLKKAKLRGEDSFGMMCSEEELGLGKGGDGIMIINPAIKAGTPLGELFGGLETVVDLEITWNRADCLSVMGVARELAALMGQKVKVPEVATWPAGAEIDERLTVAVDAPQECPRYTARLLDGVTIGPSPMWMQNRLRHCGLRPVNVVVDITNYVMLECGQPLHAFDYEKLAGKQLNVRLAKSKENLETIDHTKRELTDSMLVIADAEQAVAVAGVMGGASSEVSDATQTIALESATFYAPCIKDAATTLAMRSDSSHRFERGVDPNLADWASRRAGEMMVAYAGGQAVAGAIDVDYRKAVDSDVSLRYARARAVIGVDISDDKMREILSALGFVVSRGDGVEDWFSVPSYRLDIEREADLIEEVARVFGLDALPDVSPTARVVSDADESPYMAQRQLREALVGLGLMETMNYSFLSAKYLDLISPSTAAQRLVLPNPVSADFAVMRDSLIPQMIETLGRNHARQVSEAALFEMGRCFWTDELGAAQEESRLVIGLMGPIGRGNLAKHQKVKPAEVLCWMKGVLESLVADVHAEELTIELASHDAMVPGFTGQIKLGGEVVGTLGCLRKEIGHKWRISGPVAVAELKLLPLIKHISHRADLQEVPAYPGIQRDIALVVPAAVTHGMIEKTITSSAPQELTAVTLFDIFKSKEIGNAKQSMAYSLEYRSTERTLTDEEVNGFHQTVLNALSKELQVEIRDC